MRVSAKSTKYTNKLTMALHLITRAPLFKQMLYPSFHKKIFVASVGGATTTVNAQHWDRHAISMARRTTGHRCVEHKETPQLAAHPPHTSNKTDRRPLDKKHKKGSEAGTSNKGDSNRKATPKKQGRGGHNKTFKASSLEVIQVDLLSGPSHSPSVKYS